MAGLYLPESWPQLGDIAAFQGARYQDVAFAVLSSFTARLVQRRRTARGRRSGLWRLRCAADRAADATLGDGQYVLELFHGPTLAFKDIALQVLGQLFSRALAKRGGRATIVAATSGDTGSAAIAALGGLSNIDVFVMHRKGRVSEVQRRQMTTSTHANVHNIAIDGSFDDAQSLVKQLFADTDFAQQDQPDGGELDQLRPHRGAGGLLLHRHRATGRSRAPSSCPPAISATSSPARPPSAWGWTWRAW